MVTLKEALSLDSEALENLKKEMQTKAIEGGLNAYIDFSSSGSGVPILIKDNIQVKDWSITSGSNILQGYIAPYDATVITNLKNAGLSPFGRANMDEFAMGSTTESSFYGPTFNPHDKSRVAGGSSGGSASAVAGGIAICALGSDTGGSIRQPAAYCGCVGMKPTYGRVSRFGLSAYASSLDQIGPITQNVEDCAILYDILASHDAKDSTSATNAQANIMENLNPNRKLTIAVIDNYVSEADSEIQEAYFKTVESLKLLGHTIIHKTMSNTKYDIATYYIVATAEATTNLARFDGIRYGNRAEGDNLAQVYLNTRNLGFGDEVKRRVLLGNFVLSSGYYDAYYLKAQRVRHLIRDEFNKIFDEADLILSPVAPSVAPKIGSIHDPLEMYKSDMYTIAINLAGLPAISLPVGKNSEGMPIGLQFIAKAFNEQALFDGAKGLEKEINYKGLV
ncbi:MAG: Asp-tRNA(Asn)/Glu-tRNA(Gln) amidotransferase subunit GatA [Epsilonproteobacteria bacterium]|nr:Asp-tRNA(Asn)/Glu-tRNA(Gln) amidotransferase subunit GatA [Campylobacterota bacterium]MBD3839531.1 Asp-tRNA(Asn)/Glu-tRNA(Gln) amidotransferase subunit GatA [Campylobacterota bacterium]